jgi:hypothetical protein
MAEGKSCANGDQYSYIAEKILTYASQQEQQSFTAPCKTEQSGDHAR